MLQHCRTYTIYENLQYVGPMCIKQNIIIKNDKTLRRANL